MSTEPAHFTLTESGAFMPTPFAQSHWGDDHLNGPAVVGLAAHQNGSRKRFYNNGIKVLAEDENSPFVRAVILAESTSLATNLGTHGIGYINGDLTAAFSRLPVDDWIGIQADSHWASDGISVGTATLFDHRGAFGSGMVTAVANPAAQIDFSGDAIPLQGLNYE
jgi:hypothetical protein